MNKINVIELFGGIGAPRNALNNLFGEGNVNIVDYVENNKNAVKAYNLIFNDSKKTTDIRNYSYQKDFDIDLLFHGSPCQSFSQAGKHKGGVEGSGTESSLLWETIRIIKEMKIKPKIVIWENVKGVLNKNNIETFNNYLSTMKDLGYSNQYKVLNSKDFGIPQNRNRVFVVSIHKNNLNDFNHFDIENLRTRKMKPLKSFLENNVSHDYFIKREFWINCIKKGKIKTMITEQWRWNNAGVVKVPFYNYEAENYVFRTDIEKSSVNTITSQGANSRLKVAILIKEYSNFFVFPRKKDGEIVNGSYNRVWKFKKGESPTISASNVPKMVFDKKEKENYPIFIIDDKPYVIRVLTQKEAFLLMGFKESDYEKIKHLPKTVIYKVAGNSIVVQVLEAIFENLFTKYLTIEKNRYII